MTLRVVTGAAASLFTLCFFSSVAFADPWEDYNQHLSQYYLLDKQPVSRVTCGLSSPALDELMDLVGSKLPKDAVTIQQNLRDFSISYDRTNGVSFVTPQLNIQLASQKMSNPEKAQQDVEQLKKGFAEAVDGMKDIIASVMEGMISPKKESLQNLSVSTKEGTTRVSYLQDGQNHEDVYSGNSEQSTQTAPSLSVKAKLDYETLKEKLVLVRGAALGNVGPNKVGTNFLIQYQDLGKILFPAKIINDVSLEANGSQQKKHLEISFKNCSIGN